MDADDTTAGQPERQDQRAAILAAARRVFLDTGFAGARTRRIADEAGVTEASLYRCFSSKTEIYKAAVIEPLLEFVTWLRTTTDAIDTDAEPQLNVLRAVNQTLFEFMMESGPLLAVALLSDLDEGRHFYDDELYPVLSGPINNVVSTLTGWVAQDERSSVVYTAFFGVHLGLALDARLRGLEPDRVDVARQLTRLFSRGISKRTQTAAASFPAIDA